MATLFITEFTNCGRDAQNTPMPVMDVSNMVEQTVTISGSSTPSTNALSATTTLVRIHTDTSCSIAFGVAPTATTSKLRIPAGCTEYFRVPPNSNYKIAVITN